MKDYSEYVERALKEHECTRDDDHKLFVWVVYYIKPELLNQPFRLAFFYASENGMPSYESISRCRRKLQEKHPSLRGTTWEKRHEKENDYIRKYSRGGRS